MAAFIGIAGAQDNNTNSNNTVDENDVDNAKLGAIVGKVINPEGDPLARVVVYLSSPISSKPPENAEQKQVTNERGYFEFVDLLRGEYVIYTKFEGYEPYREIVKVPAGEKVEIKIVLIKEQNEQQFSILYGFVFNALGNEPVGGAFIQFYSVRSDFQPPTAESDDSGQFKVRLMMDQYTIVAEARGFEPFKEEMYIEEKEMKMEIPLKPIKEEEPQPDPEPERKRPMLSGHIYDAETDKPIYGWVELSYGNPEIRDRDPEPIPQEVIDEELERKELEEQKLRELEERKLMELEERENKEQETNGEDPKTRSVDDPEKPEIPPEPEQPVKVNKPGDYFLWRTYSDRSGFYHYDVIPPGHYEMRVFAPGHKMYYNEITIRDKPQYIDVYLLREPEPQLWSVITGQVVDKRTKEPISGALVCVVPPELIQKLRELKDDDAEALGLNMDMDLNDIDDLLNSDIEIDFEMIPEDELLVADPNIMPPEPPMPQELINEELKEPNPGTRGEIEKVEDSNAPIKLREYLKKFCTKTDERGMFKLRVNPGPHVLIVKAKGYELFARKFEIGPGQIMKVRIPIKPVNDTELTSSEKAKDDSTNEGGDTLDVLGISNGASGTTVALNTTLVTLIIIALILGAIVLHRRRIIPKQKNLQK